MWLSAVVDVAVPGGPELQCFRPAEPLEASDEDSLLGPSAASSAAAAAANSHALAAAAAMAAGSIAGSLGSQSPKSKPPSLSAPVIIGKDGKPYILHNQERRSNALAALKLICDSRKTQR